MRLRTRLVFAALAVALAAWPAAARDRWLHVTIDETRDEPQTVRVNLPIALIESAIPLLESAKFDGSRIRVGDESWDKARLKALWDEVKRAEGGEYVTVQSGSESVRVAKTKDLLTVKVRDSRRGEGKVDVKIPLSVVDALLSGPGDQLNIAAAVRALGSRDDGELVAIDDDSSVVRIWIDQTNAE